MKNLFFLFLLASSFKTHANQCVEVLSFSISEKKPLTNLRVHDERVFVDAGFAITGAGKGDHSIDQVLTNLQITDRDLMIWRNLGKKVLSVAEGESPFVPYLVKQGISTKGLDLWYSSDTALPQGVLGDRMRDYREENQNYLVEGSAFNMPFPDESFDFVITHFLMNNLEEVEIQHVINEVIRVTTRGGVSIHFPFSWGQFQSLMAYLAHNHIDEAKNFRLTPEWALIYEKE